MKNTALIVLIVFVASSAFSNRNNTDDPLIKNGAPAAKSEALLNTSVVIANGIAFFELSVLNEATGGVYALKREFSDGRFVSVQLRKINTNTYNLPVVYTFEDRNVPKEDFTYVLLRIVPETRKFKVIQRWAYCCDRNEICPMDHLATN